MIGTIIPVGRTAAHWMYVTREKSDYVQGYLWIGTKKRWTKTNGNMYARSVIGCRKPTHKKPTVPPQGYSQILPSY